MDFRGHDAARFWGVGRHSLCIDAGVSSPNFRQDVLDECFAQHCPSHNNSPPSKIIGVAALAHPDLLIEIVAVAALPD